ncbi:SusC/RagA family TonB-linked outer membrane protein [Chitinophaga caseinilytica]|uniref:SusC/RagA family TonB-linked outer membrane protein n=1 Tax=Chitinophaga caseinilytica TaxID=2267521 RepID=UPI003C2B7A1D
MMLHTTFKTMLLTIFTICLCAESYAQSFTGRVTDVGNLPLAGVSVRSSDGAKATQTNEKGEFTLQVKSGTVLRLTYVGFTPQDITYNGSPLQIIMERQAETIVTDVVVIGYGTARKKDVTGTTARANLTAFRESPNVNILQSLQGSVPGLNVGAVTTAGSSPSVSIRGRTSLSGTTSPLIVLDGIIFRGNLADINPADIASVDVLKDASATAIYGSQASNGVLLMTTKTGRAGKKPLISYNGALTLSQVSNRDMLPLDKEGYLQFVADRWINESRTGANLDAPNPSWDPLTRMSAESAKGFQAGVNTDWWQLLTNRNPLMQNHDVSVSGRSENTAYFFSLGYTNQENVIINDTYKRYSFRVNLESKVASWLKVGVQSSYGISDYSGVAPTLTTVIRNTPFLSAYDSTGKPLRLPDGSNLNPILQTQQNNLDKRYNLFGLMYADVTVPWVKGLNYRVNFGQNYVTAQQFNFDLYGANFTGSGSKMNSSEYNQTLDHIFNYRREFGDHGINATFVYGFEKRKFEQTNANASNFANPALGYHSLEAGQPSLQTVNSDAWKETSLYQMYRLIYSYKDRYVFTGTVRNDGFSGFGPGNKTGVFPSAALAWRITEEPWAKGKLGKIDDLKFRLSYGANGNRTVGRYQTLSRMNASIANGYLFGDGGLALQGQGIGSLANQGLKWETTKTLNFGLDFSLYSGRLSGEVNYYTANTSNLLYTVNIPSVNGQTSIPFNVGKLHNKGVELALNGTPVRNKNFSWDVNTSFSLNRNKVVSITGIDANKDGKEDDLVASKIFIGQPYGVAYDYNIIGMWQVADRNAGIIPGGFTYGTYKVEDMNNDGAYTAAADRKILGYTDPSYRFSILNTLRYKAFEFKMFVNSIQGGKKYYYGQPGSTLPNPDNMQNRNFFKFDYWTPENPNARYRQIGYYSAALGETFSPYVQRSFVRLQDVTLSYSLPASITQKLNISRLSAYVNGKNLLTLSDWDGWDPESGTGLNLEAFPLLRSYTVGLNVEF